MKHDYMLAGKIGQDSSFTYTRMCLMLSLSKQDQHRLFKYVIVTQMTKVKIFYLINMYL